MGNTYLDRFMKKFEFEGLTFDDISLLTQYADFLPDQTDISTVFSKNIKMNIPFVSAAMDTVTESPMAIAMAKLGGIGVIHKNLDPARQADEVRKVKQYLNGLIRNPVVFHEDITVEEMLNEKNNNSEFGLTVSEEATRQGILDGLSQIQKNGIFSPSLADFKKGNIILIR